MTTRYYGASIGAGLATDITEDTSSTGKAIELVVVTSTSGMTKMDVLKALEALEYRITQDNWPPA